MEYIMKQKLLLSLMLMLLALVACDNRNGDNYPSQTEIWQNPTEDFYLMVEHYRADVQKYDVININLYSKDNCTKVVLNGQNYYQDYYVYMATTGYYDHYFDFDHSTWDILDNNNGILNYQIFFPTRTVSGSIRMPALHQTAYPVFDQYQDWNLAWTLSENPDFQTCSIYMKNSADNRVRDFVEFSGKDRSHVWNKNIWARLGTIDGLEMRLTANNYVHKDGGVVWAIRQNELDQYLFTPNRQRDHHQRWKQLLSGEIRLKRDR